MKEDYKRHCGFYDISADAEEVIIENAIKAFGGRDPNITGQPL